MIERGPEAADKDKVEVERLGEGVANCGNDGEEAGASDQGLHKRRMSDDEVLVGCSDVGHGNGVVDLGCCVDGKEVGLGGGDEVGHALDDLLYARLAG